MDACHRGGSQAMRLGPWAFLRGAVSLDGNIHDHGAVGLVLTGEQLQVMTSWGV